MNRIICAISVLAMLLCLCACAPAEEKAPETTVPFETVGCQHNYEKTVGTAATCDKEGVMNLKCVYCKAETTEPIPANGHDFSTATCTTPSTCASCGATEGSVLPHTYDDNGHCVDCGTTTGNKKDITEGVWSYTDRSEGMKQYTLKAKVLSLAMEDNTGDQAAVTYKVNENTVTVTGEGFTLTLERASDTTFKVAATTGESAVLPPVDAIFVYASK